LANLNRLFSAFARWTAHHAGRASTFIVAVAVVAAWAVTGPLFGFSDTWQLVINTGTTIVTFLIPDSPDGLMFCRCRVPNSAARSGC
jgi:low affinity Fe/Cu permease